MNAKDLNPIPANTTITVSSSSSSSIEKKEDKSSSSALSTSATNQYPYSIDCNYKCIIVAIYNACYFLSISAVSFVKPFFVNSFCPHKKMIDETFFHVGDEMQTMFHFLMAEYHRVTLKEFKAKFPARGKVKLQCQCPLFLAIIYDRIDIFKYLCSRIDTSSHFGGCFHLALLLKRPEHLHVLGDRLMNNQYCTKRIMADDYLLQYEMSYLFDTDHAQIIMTDFPGVAGWELVCQNISNAFRHLHNVRDIAPYLPFISTLMDLSCIFFPGSRKVSLDTVLSWLQIAAYCLQNHFSWIKMRHLRLWRCFSAMHPFFPHINKPDLSVEHHPAIQLFNSTIPTPTSPITGSTPTITPTTTTTSPITSLERFSQHPLFDVHLLDIIFPFVVNSSSARHQHFCDNFPPSPPLYQKINPECFSSWKEIFLNLKQLGAFRHVIAEEDFNPTLITLPQRPVKNFSTILVNLAPTRLVRNWICQRQSDDDDDDDDDKLPPMSLSENIRNFLSQEK